MNREPLDWSETPEYIGTFYERRCWADGWNAAMASVEGESKHCDFPDCVLPYGHVSSCRTASDYDEQFAILDGEF